MTTRLNLFTIPPHRAFADALAQGLIRRHGGDPLRLARGVVLVPTNRAKRTITDAFVRASGGGLLLPRMVAIGDPELDEAAGPFLDPADDDAPIPPAVDPLQRRMILARLIEAHDRSVDAAEAVRLAGDLGRTLDQMLVEEIAPRWNRAFTWWALSARKPGSVSGATMPASSRLATLRHLSPLPNRSQTTT